MRFNAERQTLGPNAAIRSMSASIGWPLLASDSSWSRAALAARAVVSLALVIRPRKKVGRNITATSGIMRTTVGTRVGNIANFITANRNVAPQMT